MKIALILQGGGARGIFTCGVTDRMLEDNITFDAIYAVSAGGLNGISYLSKQPYRTYKCWKECMKIKSLIKAFNPIKNKCLVDMKSFYEELELIEPYDYDTYKNNKTKFILSVTNLETGKAEYFSSNPINYDVLSASASLPYLTKKYKINNNFYKDGGTSDPIPFKKAMDDGYDKIVVVLTRPLSILTTPKTEKEKKKLYRRYKNYPNYAKAEAESHLIYHKEIEELSKLQDKIFIFDPLIPIPVNHIDTNQKKLEEAYQLGINVYNKQRDAFLKYISK